MEFLLSMHSLLMSLKEAGKIRQMNNYFCARIGFIDPVFAKTSLKRSFSAIQNSFLWLEVTVEGSIDKSDNSILIRWIDFLLFLKDINFEKRLDQLTNSTCKSV